MTFFNPVRAFHVTLASGSVELVLSPATGGDNLPGTNVVAPGVYNIFGQQVDMTAEGLYRISDFAGRAAQRISYSSNFDELLSGIANMNQLGEADAAPYAPIALTRKISTACGGQSQNAIAILGSIGWLAREVNGLTTSPFNGYDDGHTIDEVAINGQWCAIDFDMKYDFWKPDGTRASFLYVCDNIATPGAVVMRSLTSLQRSTDATFGGAKRYVWYQNDHVTGSQANTLANYQRNFQMPYIFRGSGKYDVKCETPAQIVAATSYSSSMMPMDRATFLSKYYSMPIYHYGTGPSGTTGAGNLYTFVDRSTQIPAGTIVGAVGVAFNNPHAVTFMLMRENSPSNYDVVWTSTSFAHPGGGYVDDACGFTLPSDGAVYRLAFSASLPNTPAEIFGNGPFNRAQMLGVASGSGVTMSPQYDGTFCMRWS